MNLHILKRVIVILCLSLLFLSAHAQNKDSSHIQDSIQQPSIDTNSLVEIARRFGENEIRESQKQFREDLYATTQKALLDAIRKETFEARDFVKQGIDTTGFTTELNKINEWYNISADGIFIHSGSAQTIRNLATSKVIVQELLERLLSRKTALDTYNKRLLVYRNRIDSFATDSAMFIAPADSENVVHYFSNLVIAAREISPADSILKAAIRNTESLQTKVNTIKNSLSVSLDNIENYQKDLSGETFKRDFPNLGDSVNFNRPFKKIVHFSTVKGELALYFYVENNFGKLLLLLLLIFLSFTFLSSLKSRLKEDNGLREDLSGQLVLRYPALSAILIVINLFQFIFIAPPFIFNFILWTVCGIALTIIFKGFITKYWMNVWLTVFTFFIVSSILNLILQASRTERWIMLGISGTGFIATSFIVFTGNKQVLKEKWIIYFIGLTAIIEIAASFTNIYGRYNLSKMLLTSGYFNVVIAILFLWTTRLLNEGLAHAHDLYTVPERRLFYINFERVGNEVPWFLKVLLIIGWFILFGRNFYAFKTITDPIENFLFKDRTIGDYSFSLESIVLFFGILILASVISRIVSFFASDKHDSSGNRIKGVGSWLLLIRISITSIGLFFAFAAAGIPVDRITIIIGALSVGIGFGLQTLINNLVSGLILSFEKPVNVGDMVEISGKGGVMKSIGFRSSIMTTWDGAEVIIPNGDLLNEHLVNWTLNDSTRRIDLIIGVAYETDLIKAKQVLLNIVSNDERVLKIPAPTVIAKEFNSSSIDFQLSFWAKNIREWTVVKSDAIIGINEAFKLNNISIPFPQQEVHIHKDKI